MAPRAPCTHPIHPLCGLVAMARRPHPFPSRTRPLSSSAPMVLRGQPRGRVGRRQPIPQQPPNSRSPTTGCRCFKRLPNPSVKFPTEKRWAVCFKLPMPKGSRGSPCGPPSRAFSPRQTGFGFRPTPSKPPLFGLRLFSFRTFLRRERLKTPTTPVHFEPSMLFSWNNATAENSTFSTSPSTSLMKQRFCPKR